MRHFYFIENETGEEFIVGADTLEMAWMAADEVADCISREYQVKTFLTFEYEMDDDEAEASGLDEY